MTSSIDVVFHYGLGVKSIFLLYNRSCVLIYKVWVTCHVFARVRQQRTLFFMKMFKTRNTMMMIIVLGSD